jgi:hypothetical protein
MLHCALTIILKVKKKLVQPTVTSNWISHLFTSHLFFLHIYNLYFAMPLNILNVHSKWKIWYIYFLHIVSVCVHCQTFIHSYILQYDTLLNWMVWGETRYAMTKQVACCGIFKSYSIVCCEIEQACFLLKSAWLGNRQKAIRNRLWHDGGRPKHTGVPHY